MGCLLKETLKALCGPNWSYAVFWKFAPQKPMLLIWEECYYRPALCSGRPVISGNANLEVDFELGFPVENEACLLMNKMMIEARVNIVRQGLVGRVAFSGNHLWMLSKNHCREVHPPEVLKVVSQQFSAGIRTVAAIPVLPLGVIQFGSYLRIPEDVRFVNNVVSLVTRLGHVPSVLQPQNFAGKEQVSKTGLPVCPGYSTLYGSSMMCAGSFTADDSFSHDRCSEQTSVLEGQQPYILPGGIEDDLQPSVDVFWTSNLSPCDLPGFVKNNVKQKMISPSNLMNDANACVQPQSGNGLFDLSAADFEHGLFSRCENSWPNYQYHAVQGNSDTTSSDAVISEVHPSEGDNVSCRITLTNHTSSNGLFGGSKQMKGIPVNLATMHSKEESGVHSQTSSVYNSWIENGKENNSVSMGGYSRKPQETKKTNGKRVKLAENSRRRTKDRQMIKDRLKELRELVPEGGKCSIDALLQGTVKHMLFLQSITKRANKLKHPPESKIQ